MVGMLTRLVLDGWRGFFLEKRLLRPACASQCMASFIIIRSGYPGEDHDREKHRWHINTSMRAKTGILARFQQQRRWMELTEMQRNIASLRVRENCTCFWGKIRTFDFDCPIEENESEASLFCHTHFAIAREWGRCASVLKCCFRLQTIVASQSTQAHQTHPRCCHWLCTPFFRSQSRNALITSIECYNVHLLDSFSCTSPGDFLHWTLKSNTRCLIPLRLQVHNGQTRSCRPHYLPHNLLPSNWFYLSKTRDISNTLI